MVLNVESIELILFFILGTLFVIFMNVQAHYNIKLKKLLKKKYPNLYKDLIWIDLVIGGLFIARPIFRLSRYIWFKSPREKDILFLVKKIRLFKSLAIGSILLFLIIIIILSLIAG